MRFLATFHSPSLPQPVRRRAALALVLATCLAAPLAQAQSDASLGLSALPLGSIAVGASAVGASAGAVVALPLALSVGGTVLIVKSVQVSARGTALLLEGASDGARSSVDIATQAGHGLSVAVGSTVVVGVIASGVLLSAAGEVLCFLPNAAGRALLYDERLD